MRFLANENIPLASVTSLRNAGYEVLSASEIMTGAIDEYLLSYARQNNLIIIMFDRDYGELIYRKGLPSPLGVLYLRFDPQSPTEAASFILRLLERPEIILENKFTTARCHQIRQRPLPPPK